ncbi:hypothetical protein ACKP2L_01480 [Oenococcus alcoholitolerans]|uniref:hypothetical protein n=1 Tax=Oenococcus alcoholitolerans TaxID=931074 RepID=UPI003F6ED029
MTKDEWIENFKNTHGGREPKPKEFRRALNNGDFSLEEQSQADQPSLEKRSMAPKAPLSKRIRSSHNGISSLVLSFLSFLLTLMPLIIIFRPSFLDDLNTRAEIENTSSMILAVFFLGCLLLVLSFVFAIPSLFEKPRHLAFIALCFSLLNGAYVYSLLAFAFNGGTYLTNIINLLRTIFS